MFSFQKILQAISNLPIGHGNPFTAYYPSYGYYPLPPTLPLPPQAIQSAPQAQIFSSIPLPTRSTHTSLSTTPFPASTSAAQVENTNGTKSRGGKGTRGGKRSCGNKRGNFSRAASPVAALAVGNTAGFALAPAASPGAALISSPAAAPASFLAPDVQEFSSRTLENNEGGIEEQEGHIQQRARKKARTRNMNQYEKPVLIRECCEHADEYRALK